MKYIIKLHKQWKIFFWDQTHNKLGPKVYPIAVFTLFAIFLSNLSKSVYKSLISKSLSCTNDSSSLFLSAKS